MGHGITYLTAAGHNNALLFSRVICIVSPRKTMITHSKMPPPPRPRAAVPLPLSEYHLCKVDKSPGVVVAACE